jgi:hypothetical protein
MPAVRIGRRSAMRATPPTYEIRIAGQLDETREVAFAGLNVASHGQVTVIIGEFDQAALHGLLEKIRLLGLDLVEARRVSGPPRRAVELGERDDQAHL